MDQYFALILFNLFANSYEAYTQNAVVLLQDATFNGRRVQEGTAFKRFVSILYKQVIKKIFTDPFLFRPNYYY
jgi:hypothetical protein